MAAPSCFLHGARTFVKARFYFTALPPTQSSSLNSVAYETSLHVSLVALSWPRRFSLRKQNRSTTFKAAAEKKNSVLTIPDWPQTPEAVER